MRIVERGDAIDPRTLPGPRRSHFFPSLCRLSSGRTLLAARRGTDKVSADATCVVAESGDGGRTWALICDSLPRRVAGVEGEIRACELLELDDGRLLAYLTWIDRSGDTVLGDDDPVRAKAPRRLAVTASADGGRRWCDPALLDAGAAGFPVLSGAPQHLPNGMYLVPFESQEPAAGGRPPRHVAGAILTGDGRTTSRIVTVARDPRQRTFYYDQRLGTTADGRTLVAGLWTYDRVAERDLTVHLARAGADSLDWSQPQDTGLVGQIATPVGLADGRLLLFYVRRTHPHGLRLIASPDGGRSWDADGELVVHALDGGAQAAAPDDGGAEAGGYRRLWRDMAIWTYGHPSAVRNDDGTVLLAYYAGDDERTLGVRWALVEP